jgi:hypothetical protein
MTAFGATRSQNKTATFGRHTCTKAMAALANQIRRLKCALHSDLPQTVARTHVGFEGGNFEPVLYAWISGLSTQAVRKTCNIRGMMS